MALRGHRTRKKGEITKKLGALKGKVVSLPFGVKNSSCGEKERVVKDGG